MAARGPQAPRPQPLHGNLGQVFYDYTEYILGPDIVGFVSNDASGAIISRPPLHIVLEYEHELWRKAARLMNEGRPFAEAPAGARHGHARACHFLTPLTMSALDGCERRRSRSPRRAAFPPTSAASGDVAV